MKFDELHTKNISISHQSVAQVNQD